MRWEYKVIKLSDPSHEQLERKLREYGDGEWDIISWQVSWDNIEGKAIDGLMRKPYNAPASGEMEKPLYA